MQPNNNNLVTEISAIILAGLLAIIGSVLLYLGKIDFTSASFFYITALGLFGFNSAFKAPSPSQQNQLQQIIQSITTNPNTGPALVEAISELRSSHSYLSSLIQSFTAANAPAPNPVTPQVQVPPPQGAVPPFNVPTPVTPTPVLSEDSFPMAAIGRLPQQVPPAQ